MTYEFIYEFMYMKNIVKSYLNSCVPRFQMFATDGSAFTLSVDDGNPPNFNTLAGEYADVLAGPQQGLPPSTTCTSMFLCSWHGTCLNMPHAPLMSLSCSAHVWNMTFMFQSCSRHVPQFQSCSIYLFQHVQTVTCSFLQGMFQHFLYMFET